MGRKNKQTFNKHAAVRTRTTFNGKLRTETANRDDSFSVAASTTPRDNSSRLYIDTEEGTIVLDGRQMRTLARVLLKHYDASGKDLPANSSWY